MINTYANCSIAQLIKLGKDEIRNIMRLHDVMCKCHRKDGKFLDAEQRAKRLRLQLNNIIKEVYENRSWQDWRTFVEAFPNEGLESIGIILRIKESS